ncbi:unnamed protein product, partial [Closterium sp. NIES-54]
MISYQCRDECRGADCGIGAWRVVWTPRQREGRSCNDCRGATLGDGSDEEDFESWYSSKQHHAWLGARRAGKKELAGTSVSMSGSVKGGERKAWRYASLPRTLGERASPSRAPMCILLPCADPAAPGVWWRDDAQWRRYPPHLENAVRDAIARRLPSVDLGTFASDVYPNGARYTADLRAMKQRNAQSGYAREIRVIGAALPAPAPSQALGMPNQQGLQLPGGVPMPTIHWRDSGNNLRQSDAATARAIFRAGAQGYMCAQTAPIITDAYPLGVVYTIDLQRMVQRNPFTGRERDVVVQFPHNPLELLKLALGATGQDRKQLLGATLEAFCSEDNVMKMLAGKISPYQIIAKRRNPNLQLGQPVFDKFVQSMEGIATGCANLSP